MQKRYFTLLDGIRGYAAISVLFFHAMPFFGAKYLPFGAGYMAVDLFFVLSGFVLQYQYGERLRTGEMTLATFTKRRLLRVYPLAILGAVLGLVVYFGIYKPDRILDAGFSPAAILSAITMLPMNLFGTAGYYFDYNGPAWSLSVEMVGGFIFAIALVRLRLLPLLVLMAAMAVLNTLESNLHGHLHVGFKADKWWIGYTRFLYAFTAGMLICRYLDRLVWARVLFWPVLLATLVFPALPAISAVRMTYILVLFPVLVAAAAHIDIKGRVKTVAHAIGWLSFPLYAVHAPVLAVIGTVLKRAGMETHHNPVAGLIALPITFAIAILVGLYAEKPLRAALLTLTRRLRGLFMLPSDQTVPASTKKFWAVHMRASSDAKNSTIRAT